MLEMSFDDLVALGLEIDVDGLVEGKSWYKRLYALIDIAVRWEDAKHAPGRKPAVSFDALVKQALAADVEAFMVGTPARQRMEQILTLGRRWSQQKA